MFASVCGKLHYKQYRNRLWTVIGCTRYLQGDTEHCVFVWVSLLVKLCPDRHYFIKKHSLPIYASEMAQWGCWCTGLWQVLPSSYFLFHSIINRFVVIRVKTHGHITKTELLNCISSHQYLWHYAHNNTASCSFYPSAMFGLNAHLVLWKGHSSQFTQIGLFIFALHSSRIVAGL